MVFMLKRWLAVCQLQQGVNDREMSFSFTAFHRGFHVPRVVELAWYFPWRVPRITGHSPRMEVWGRGPQHTMEDHRVHDMDPSTVGI